jgi:tetrahydromethanopterin:alpha-L-glutamate ligase
LKVPIFTDDPGWHGQQLKQAFAEQGVEAVFVSLQACVIDLSKTTPQINIPGFETLPKAGFVRGVSGGTLQQIITRLNILHIMSMLGVKIYNDGKAIERTVDKGLTSFLLQLNGIATPKTWVCESRKHAEAIRREAAQRQQALVIKPLFGSQGVGVRLLPNEAPLPVPMERFVDGIYYLQQAIVAPTNSHDYRLFVINDQVVAAMKRVGENWLNNVAAGGRCEAVTPNATLVDLAIKATQALNIHYAGIDIMEGLAGDYYVIEVNSIPAWKGLQSVTHVNIAKSLVADFLSN